MASEAVISSVKAPPGAFTFSRRRREVSPLRLAALAIALLVIVPIAVVLSSLLEPEQEIWQHMIEYVLGELALNTLWLILGVAFGTTVLGVSLAWLTAVCEFPGRRIFSWALLLPLAIPAYVIAFVVIALLDFTGPLQSWLREVLAPDVFKFPSIRSRGGVIVVMVLALYPYVYLLTRNAFATQGKRALEAAQSLGLTRTQGFFRVALPMARPWIMGGLMLALMETLADFGTVATFNYDTFTTAIYKAWYGMFSLPAASQIASLLILLVFALLLMEQQLRSRVRYTQAGRHGAPAERIRLRGTYAWGASLYAGLVLACAFVIPVTQLSIWAAKNFAKDFDSRYIGFLWHSLTLSGLAALITCLSALVLAYASRQHNDATSRATLRIATLGYALPGAVLAVGTFIPIAWIDNQLIAAAKYWLGWNPGPIFQGTLLAMMLAYLVRFMSVGFNPVEAAMHRITRSIDEAARCHGVAGFAMLRRVHLPILRGGLLTAATLVFVDVMKEMPITLMTRPFGWDTLAIRIFEMTSEGEWERAALPAIALVLAGLLPIMILTRSTET